MSWKFINIQVWKNGDKYSPENQQLQVGRQVIIRPKPDSGHFQGPIKNVLSQFSLCGFFHLEILTKYENLTTINLTEWQGCKTGSSICPVLNSTLGTRPKSDLQRLIFRFAQSSEMPTLSYSLRHPLNYRKQS